MNFFVFPLSTHQQIDKTTGSQLEVQNLQGAFPSAPSLMDKEAQPSTTQSSTGRCRKWKPFCHWLAFAHSPEHQYLMTANSFPQRWMKSAIALLQRCCLRLDKTESQFSTPVNRHLNIEYDRFKKAYCTHMFKEKTLKSWPTMDTVNPENDAIIMKEMIYQLARMHMQRAENSLLGFRLPSLFLSQKSPPQEPKPDLPTLRPVSIKSVQPMALESPQSMFNQKHGYPLHIKTTGIAPFCHLSNTEDMQALCEVWKKKAPISIYLKKSRDEKLTTAEDIQVYDGTVTFSFPGSVLQSNPSFRNLIEDNSVPKFLMGDGTDDTFLTNVSLSAQNTFHYEKECQTIMESNHLPLEHKNYLQRKRIVMQLNPFGDTDKAAFTGLYARDLWNMCNNLNQVLANPIPRAASPICESKAPRQPTHRIRKAAVPKPRQKKGQMKREAAQTELQKIISELPVPPTSLPVYHEASVTNKITEEPVTVYDINNDVSLSELCEHLQYCAVLGVDTERSSGNTLSLIQISDGKRAYLIRTTDIKNWKPLKHLFSNTKVIKVFHNKDVDIAALSQQFTFRVKNVKDTEQIQMGQMAANNKLGNACGIALKSLLAGKLGLDIKKAKPPHYWNEYPLSTKSITYAVEDALYLPLLLKVLEQSQP